MMKEFDEYLRIRGTKILNYHELLNSKLNPNYYHFIPVPLLLATMKILSILAFSQMYLSCSELFQCMHRAQPPSSYMLQKYRRNISS